MTNCQYGCHRLMSILRPVECHGRFLFWGHRLDRPTLLTERVWFYSTEYTQCRPRAASVSFSLPKSRR